MKQLEGLRRVERLICWGWLWHTTCSGFRVTRFRGLSVFCSFLGSMVRVLKRQQSRLHDPDLLELLSQPRKRRSP